MASKIESVRGARVTIHFDTARCIHARNCVLSRPDVFVPNIEGEWIHPDNATPEEIAALAANCPSGAITYERHDGAGNETAPRVNTVRVRENGPLALHAAMRIGDGDTTFRATLCRCGASARKPYCDGSHVTANFRATGEPPTQPSEPLATRNGALNITPLPNGPLKASGALEVVSGTGRTCNRVTETFLCRCGASANKPYCDGTHRKISFSVE